MNNYFMTEIEAFIMDAKDSFISFFPDDFFIRLILVIAALVIVFGIARLFEKEETEEII